MPTTPEIWESATPVFGIRYPKPTAPAVKLPDAFNHIGNDLETALIADAATPPGLNYRTGTDAQRLAAAPAQDLIWVVTDVAGNPKYIGTGTVWVPLTSSNTQLQSVQFASAADTYIAAAGAFVAFAGTQSGTNGLVTRNGAGTVFTLTKAGLWRIDQKVTGDVAATATMQSRMYYSGGPVIETAVYVAGNSDRAATAWGAHYYNSLANVTVGVWLSSAAAFAAYSWSTIRFTYLGPVAATPQQRPEFPDGSGPNTPTPKGE